MLCLNTDMAYLHKQYKYKTVCSECYHLTATIAIFIARSWNWENDEI